MSKVDPEAKFCARHRRCVYPRVARQTIPVIKVQEKYTDFETFKLSCVENFEPG